MKEIYNAINQIIAERKKAAMCIITETKGSTPRKIGSKMIVLENGQVIGSIGGGELEHFVVEKSQEIIKTGDAETFNFGLKEDFQMSCGGRVTVFVEPVKLPDQLIVFGGGHICRSLVTYAKNFDFNITVVDEREGIFDSWAENDFTLINKIHIEAYPELKFDDQTYVCIMTHAHKYDKIVAGYCGSQNSKFTGVIASKTKAAKIRKELIEEKVLTQEQAEAIEMPLGIPMKCELPEEIAISVLGRLIDVKNQK
ncbi:MAG: XdhC family protein [Bacteroidales bacterium]|nr:XdhC family protein [Bacteroidales bacterium]